MIAPLFIDPPFIQILITQNYLSIFIQFILRHLIFPYFKNFLHYLNLYYIILYYIILYYIILYYIIFYYLYLIFFKHYFISDERELFI